MEGTTHELILVKRVDTAFGLLSFEVFYSLSTHSVTSLAYTSLATLTTMAELELELLHSELAATEYAHQKLKHSFASQRSCARAQLYALSSLLERSSERSAAGIGAMQRVRRRRAAQHDGAALAGALACGSSGIGGPSSTSSSIPGGGALSLERWVGDMGRLSAALTRVDRVEAIAGDDAAGQSLARSLAGVVEDMGAIDRAVVRTNHHGTMAQADHVGDVLWRWAGAVSAVEGEIPALASSSLELERNAVAEASYRLPAAMDRPPRPQLEPFAYGQGRGWGEG